MVDGERPLLIATVGLPRSGKSTWVRQAALWLRAGIVSSDAWRRAVHGREFLADSEPLVWGLVETAVHAAFLGGHETVILDAANSTRARRRRWTSRHWKTRYKVIDTPQALCLERARGGSEGLKVAISRMASEWEGLGPDELPYEAPDGLIEVLAAHTATSGLHA